MINSKVIKSYVSLFLPPIISSCLHKVYRKLFQKDRNPNWYQVRNGLLAGRELYVNGYHPSFKSMLDGSYDAFFYEYLQKLKLENGIVCDIGAHIGYHTLCLACYVGPFGKVLAFEPNPYNFERLTMNINRNSELRDRIQIYNFALSAHSGVANFHLSKNVDNFTSSGSFIEGAHVPLPYGIYKKSGFIEHRVVTKSLDDLILGHYGDYKKINLIKIDVEGAENLVIKGAEKLINAYKPPILLIEVHSVISMLNVASTLFGFGYKIIPLKESERSRCFIIAEPK